MTFQEAQAQFAAITATITPARTPAELLQIQKQLRGLKDSLPNQQEFDPIVDAITTLSPKLFGQVAQKTIEDLRSRTAELGAATKMLDQVAADAAADARVLRLEKPQLLAAGLVKGLETVRELRDAAKDGDLAAAGAKADALLALLAQMQSTLKVG